ncbi:hypothetical protein OOZ51_19185 [Arthrobacter sp. MI7-26]|uniref:hypothetical protein n=1 Tax=Arthrobacter sp. MI7-26 TaxID=2993653 RepID=UPI002248A5C3|nr:hypothetical protein [Arthrobacter sp. MI7-26]MCX2749918.1 hypothetical protein [Arthrobacter sp. MI7-26]
MGIDTGTAMLVRGGVHGENDIVSIGSAPNVAAKLSEIRGTKTINISSAVYNRLSEPSKVSKEKNMWTLMGVKPYGGKSVTYYGSSYTWAP